MENVKFSWCAYAHAKGNDPKDLDGSVWYYDNNVDTFVGVTSRQYLTYRAGQIIRKTNGTAEETIRSVAYQVAIILALAEVESAPWEQIEKRAKELMLTIKP